MQFNFLWSGDVRGMRKAKIAATENKVGTVGTWENGKLYLPDAKELRGALPKRFHRAFDRSISFAGLPQVWMDNRSNDYPLTLRLLSSRMKPLLTIYLQPLKTG